MYVGLLYPSARYVEDLFAGVAVGSAVYVRILYPSARYVEDRDDVDLFAGVAVAGADVVDVVVGDAAQLCSQRAPVIMHHLSDVAQSHTHQTCLAPLQPDNQPN